MVSTEYTNAWIDRYLRDELTDADEARFETALLESPRLQDELEAALAVQRLLKLEARASEPEPDEGGSPSGLRLPWFTMALCASLIVAVLSGVMYWDINREIADMRTGIKEPGALRAQDVLVPLDIMRSASQDLPEAIIHRPDDGGDIVLDIELTATAVEADRLHMALRDPDGSEVAIWTAGPIRDGRVRAAFDAEFLPAGQVWLEMSDESGHLLDRRLLEFR